MNYQNEILRRERGEIDFRPSLRRSPSPCKAIGSRVSAVIAIFGDLGSSSSSSKQTATSQQVTTQGSSGSGGTAAIGAGASKNNLTLVTNTTSTDVSAPVVTAAVNAQALTSAVAVAGVSNVAGAALTANDHIANMAIASSAANTATLTNAGVLDTEAAIGGNLSVTNMALNANANLAQLAVANSQASENAISNFAAAGLYEANQVNQAGNQTIQNLAGQLGQITANASTQTPAAESEILAGDSPIQTSSGIFSSSWANVAIIAGVVITAVVFLRSGGKTA